MSRIYRRRVQRIGGSTYIVSLPTSWAREVGLEPKTEVALEVLPDLSLRLFIPARHVVGVLKEYVVNIDSSFKVHEVVREVIGGYVSGAGIIKLVFKGVKRDFVDDVVSIARDKLMGLEVIDEDSTTLVLQVVVDPNLSDLVSIVKRILRVAMSMHEDIISYIEGTISKDSLENVISRDDLVDKLYLLALRQLTTTLSDPYEMHKKGLSHVDSIYLSLFIKSLERFADHAVSIAQVLLTIPTPPTNILELYRKAVDTFRKSAEAFITNNKDSAVASIRDVEEVRKLEELVRKEISGYLIKYPLTTRVLDAISRILSRAMDIAEEVIDISIFKNLQLIQ